MPAPILIDPQIRLKGEGVPVRVIGPSRERLQAFVQRGAEPIVSEPSDRTALAKAFQDGTAVYVMLQPGYIPEGFVGECRGEVCCGTVTSEVVQELPRLCPHCQRQEFSKNGRDRRGAQVYRSDCRRSFTALTGTPFSGHSFPPAVIGLAVRWYLRFRLSYADVVEWLAERSIQVDASTVFDWVQKFAPLYQEAAKAYRRHVGQRWSVDETYVKVAGRWGYVYRAIDEYGQVVEVLFREHRDTAAAVTFFRGALENTG
jgi:transposase-like protein